MGGHANEVLGVVLLAVLVHGTVPVWKADEVQVCAGVGVYVCCVHVCECVCMCGCIHLCVYTYIDIHIDTNA